MCVFQNALFVCFWVRIAPNKLSICIATSIWCKGCFQMRKMYFHHSWVLKHRADQIHREATWSCFTLDNNKKHRQNSTLTNDVLKSCNQSGLALNHYVRIILKQNFSFHILVLIISLYNGHITFCTWFLLTLALTWLNIYMFLWNLILSRSSVYSFFYTNIL